MAAADATTPKVFLIRHGQTEWSQNGRYTGTTDIPLTSHGEDQVNATAQLVYGKGRLIDPSKIINVFLSPRTCAIKTYQLLSGQTEGYEVTENLAEWNYGDYEGRVTKDIRALRKERGLDQEREWDIWRDGCEGGESPEKLAARLDVMIEKIREIQTPHMHDSEPKDIILVAHGHTTRAFAKRWLGYDLSFPLSLMMEPGGVGILSYQHNNIKEPALLLGIGFPLQESQK